jgi:23S rRNA pseudouridine2457 synthase
MQKERIAFHYFLLNKPYGYLCQFTGEEKDLLLGDLFNFPKNVYSVGRLDKDSEGLLLLTNDNRLKTKVLDPKNKHSKTYLVQVEGDISSSAIALLESGTIEISHNGKKHRVDKAICTKISPPKVDERIPPIRFRANIPTSWIELTITEGKNRQVRKMTSAVGFPTLRLIRKSIGKINMIEFETGKVIEITLQEAEKAFK